VLAVEEPDDLQRYLSPRSAAVPKLGESASIRSMSPGLAVDDVLGTFVHLVSRSDHAIVVDRQPFS